MRRSIFALAPLALAACSFGSDGSDAASPGIPGQGSGDTRTFAVADFDRIDLRGSDDVEVVVGSGFSVRAEGNAKTLDRLRITREGQVLRIDRQARKGFPWGDDGGPVTVRITLPRIAGAKVAGSGDVAIDRVEGARFDGAIAGSGGLTVAAMHVDAATLSIAGSGDMTVAGTAGRLEVSVAGSGDVDAANLKVRAAKVAVAGSGNVRAALDGHGDVRIAGSGDVDLGGSARCTIRASGSGTVRCGG